MTPTSLSFSTRIDRVFNRQKFREVYYNNIESKNQISMPELQQRNYLFDITYALNHNISRSLRLNFTSSTNSIVKNYFEEVEEGSYRVDKSKNIWDGLWSSGEPQDHFQSINLNYNIPFNKFPLLSKKITLSL